MLRRARPSAAGGGGPAATIRGDELGGEGEHLADTDHSV
jgi:hypothetical protein